MPLIASIRFSTVDSKHSVLFSQDFSCNNNSDNKISQNNYFDFDLAFAMADKVELL